MQKHLKQKITMTALALILAACGQQNGGGVSGAEVTNTEFPEQVYWGDTHLHTSNSSDAFAVGVRLPPEDALRFAMGEEVTSSTGQKAKLSRPLDFLVIADHSDGLALMRSIYEAPRLLILNRPLVLKWHDKMHNEGMQGSREVAAELISRFAARTLPAEMMDPKNSEERSLKIWDEHTTTVDKYNQPGKFTAFHGYEYTLMPNGNNLHRVVVMRDGKEEANKMLPYTSLLGTTPDALWDWMDQYEKETGGQVLAIPHNSNISNGMMFEMTDKDGKPIDAAYAERRAKREPLVEVTQIKGDSESHPFLSPNDEFSGFGNAGWDLGNLDLSAMKTNDMLAGDYVREALKRGLEIEEKTGVNPYKLGMIGSTDSHTALATADDNNFFGKFAANEPRAKRALDVQRLTDEGPARMGWQYLSSGYAAVWATSNSREAIFDAMQRREVYATTGPRMTVRLFGGWDFSADDLKSGLVKAGYSKGVPMGGSLDASKADGAPSFLVSAMKDPEGANLDRVQIVKGWVDASGKSQEKVFNVSWAQADTRKIGSKGKLAPVGDTVDLTTATYENSIGAAELSTVWKDPEFNPAQKAFYYVRVLEIPTPRWTAYDAVRFKIKFPDTIKLKTQERAYTSPIWFSPKS